MEKTHVLQHALHVYAIAYTFNCAKHHYGEQWHSLEHLARVYKLGIKMGCKQTPLKHIFHFPPPYLGPFDDQRIWAQACDTNQISLSGPRKFHHELFMHGIRPVTYDTNDIEA